MAGLNKTFFDGCSFIVAALIQQIWLETVLPLWAGCVRGGMAKLPSGNPVRGSVGRSLRGPSPAVPPAAPPQAPPPPQPLELPGNLVFNVSKEFIDEITSLAAAGRDIPRRLRKLEGAYERNESTKMRRLHYESALAAATGQSAPAEVGAKFETGQSVHHWWSSWFKTATEPKTQLQGKNRPNWYDASIVAALGMKRVRYAGQWFDEHTYQVH